MTPAGECCRRRPEIAAASKVTPSSETRAIEKNRSEQRLIAELHRGLLSFSPELR